MIWLSWRQTRLAALGVSVLAAVAVCYFVLAGLYVRHAFSSGGVAHCIGASYTNAPCVSVIDHFINLAAGDRAGGTGHDVLSLLLSLVPALLGAFLGAPLLAREYEQGTHRLVWTQSVSRARWLTTRLLVTGAVAVSAELALSLAMTFQRGPINRIYGSIDPASFDFEGLVPIGYALFAFVLGVGFGALIRHTVPVMAATLVSFLAVKYLIEDGLRPHYLTPVPSSAQVGGALYRNAWQVNDSGAYQPNDRFWTFQLIEFAIYLVLSAVLVAVTYRAVHPRSAERGA